MKCYRALAALLLAGTVLATAGCPNWGDGRPVVVDKQVVQRPGYGACYQVTEQWPSKDQTKVCYEKNVYDRQIVGEKFRGGGGK